jgi:oligoendopeptidase F
MDYKGFNIAVHEMGHNIEQTISLNDIDYYTLNGVPNTAFTEAIAFIFQSHDLDLLGLHSADPQGEVLKTLNDFWMTYEISGVSLVDMGIWHWMYDHPNATPSELKDATIQIAKEIWNKYYAPVFKKKDVVLLAIYSHIIHSFLYIPDYAIGHLISHQIDEYLRGKEKIGPEIERMAKAGCIAPDLWMKNATGQPIGADALLKAAEKALKEYKK